MALLPFKNQRRVLNLVKLAPQLESSYDEIDEELSGPDSSRIDVTLDLMQAVGAVGGAVEASIEGLKKAESGLWGVKTNLTFAAFTAGRVESTSKTLKKLPVSVIKKSAGALETVADKAGVSIDAIVDKIDLVIDRLSPINKKLAGYQKTADRLSDLGTAAAVLELAIDQSRLAVAEGRNTLKIFEDGRWGAGDAVLSDDGLSRTLSIEDAVADDFEAAMAVFNARLVSRSAEVDASLAVLTTLFDAAAAIEREYESFAAYLNENLAEIVDQVRPPDLSGLSAFLDVLNGLGDILDVIEVVADAVETVLDWFGPVVSLINEAIELVEDATGISTLYKKIEDEIGRQVENATQPIIDALERALGPIDFDAIETAQGLLDGVVDFKTLAFDFYTNPIAMIGEFIDPDDIHGHASNDALLGTLKHVLADDGGGVSVRAAPGSAFAAGLGGDDLIWLGLEERYQDGYGGYALGGGGDDIVFGTSLKDLLIGGDGDDLVLGFGGEDLLFGSVGADTLLGGANADKLSGGSENDRLHGDGGDDALFGESGDDALAGGLGADTLVGGDGADTLTGGGGDDGLFGDDGEDVLVVTGGDNVIEGGAGLDEIRTFGAASATHLIRDADARLFGGGGRDTVELGDAFAAGATVAAGVHFDAGANRDALVAGSLDLDAFAAHFENFETLRIGGDGPEAKTLIGATDKLRAFDRLELFGSAPVEIKVTAGGFNMEALFADQPFRIDTSALAPLDNPLDGPLAGDPDKGDKSAVLPLTVRIDHDAGAELSGFRASTLGLTFIGGEGDDLIVGGGGSDLIRAGLGADTVDGGGDRGDRFDIDSAVGDVIQGTVDELSGDTVRNFTNRTDRIRIEGGTLADVAFAIVGARTIVTLEAGGATLAIEGVYEKMAARQGDGFVEIWSDNVPPDAVNEDLTIEQGEGGGVSYDPTDNDRDPDAAPGQTIELDAVEFMMIRSEESDFPRGLADGGVLITQQRGTLTRAGDMLVYRPFEASEGAATFRTIRESDGFPVVFSPDYDVTEDLPFFGFDRIEYTVFDAEGEVSNVASTDFLIRPETVDAAGARGLPQILVRGPDGQEALQTLNVTAWPAEVPAELEPPFFIGSGPTDRAEMFSAGGALGQIATAFGGNDFLDVAKGGLGLLAAGSGNDVMISTAAGSVVFDGGANADWVEGGDGDDFLSGGLLNDVIATQRTRADLGGPGALDIGTLQPNIVIGGGGDNVFALGRFDGRDGADDPRLRDSILQLDGGKDVIVGPIHLAGGGPAVADPLTPPSVNASNPGFLDIHDGPAPTPTVLAAAALQDDLIRGFDGDDEIVLALRSDWFARAFQPVVDRYFGFGDPGPWPEATGLLVTPTDLSAFTDLRPEELFGPGGVLENAGDWQIDPFAGGDPRFVIANGSDIVQTPIFGPGYNAIPGIVSYSVEADSAASDGGRSPTTTVTVSLKSYAFITTFDDNASNNPQTITDTFSSWDLQTHPFMFAQPDILGARTANAADRLAAVSRNLLPDADITFTFELDGLYRDRFELDVVEILSLLDGPLIETRDIGARTGADASAFVAPDVIAEIEDRAGVDALGDTERGAPIGLALRYVSAAPDAADDAAAVARGGAVAFDVLANDADDDGDALLVLRLTDVDEAHLDGDVANGELVQRIDPETGLGDGAFNFHAALDFVGEVSFGYVAWDGELEGAPAEVVITITGLPPVLGDDRALLPFDSDGLLSFADLLANDVDPDAGQAVDPAALSLAFDGAPFAAVSAAGVQLDAAALAALRAAPADVFGAAGAVLSLRYTVEDGFGGGASDAATVEVSLAAPFAFADAPAPFIVAEDSAIAIDPREGREGGFGDVEILAVSAPVAAGTSLVVGTAAISGDAVVFAPAADLSGLAAVIDVTLRDALGSRFVKQLTVEVTPTPDAPILRLLSPGEDPQRLSTDEDAPVAGQLLIYDADALTPADVGAAQTLAYLSQLSPNPPALDPATLSALAAVAPALASDTPVATARGGSFALAATASPMIHDFVFTPGEDDSGPDQVAFDVTQTSGGGLSTLSLAIDVAAVNDAPAFTAPPPARQVLEIGDTLEIDLLLGLVDVDGTPDLGSLSLDLAPAAGTASVVIDADGRASLLGLGAGAGTFGYTIADDLGARSALRTIEFVVNLPPVAASDAASAFAPSEVLLIDAIANDSDADGAIAYVLGDDGLPRAFDPRLAVDAGGPAGLLGAVAWSEADGAFRYVAPADAKLFGRTDLFAYEIVDDAGAVASATVAIDLVDVASGAQSLRLASTSDDSVRASAASENFLLGGGADEIAGALSDFDRDDVFDFTPDDRLRLTGVAAGDVMLTATRERAPLDPVAFPVPNADELSSPADLAPSDLFGAVPLDALTGAFIGETVLAIGDGASRAVMRLQGAFLGDFSVVADGGDALISYAPSLTGDGELAGSAAGDDIRGGEGDDTLLGLGGDDVLQGFGGDDVLNGGDGADVLIGGGGRDRLTGGPGADLFILVQRDVDDLGAAVATITDYAPSDGDRIALGIGDYYNDDFSIDLARLAVVQDATGGFVLQGDPVQPDEDAGALFSPASAAALDGPSLEVLAHFSRLAPPVAVADAASVVEDRRASGDLLANDTDADADPLAIVAVAGANDGVGAAVAGRFGTLTVQAGGAFEYVADDADRLGAGQTRNDRFAYEVSDGKGGVDAAELSIEVAGRDEFFRGTGSGDALAGSRWGDRLFGLAGDDELRGGNGRDLLVGGAGSDTLAGEGAADILFGRGGRDHLDGGAGGDRLSGGAGRDRIEGGAGRDELTGNAGRDAFAFAKGDGRGDRITDFEDGIDRIEIAGGAARFRDLDLDQRGDNVLLRFADVKIVLADMDVSSLDHRDFIFA